MPPSGRRIRRRSRSRTQPTRRRSGSICAAWAKTMPKKRCRATDFQVPTDWSPDGRFVVFMNTGFPRLANEQQSDVWLLDLARGRKLIPLLKTRFHETNATFSPDGKWLAFTSNESGRPEVYVQAF